MYAEGYRGSEQKAWSISRLLVARKTCVIGDNNSFFMLIGWRIGHG
jgi:hypothetical protein